MAHQCPKNDCTRSVPTHMLACREHWKLVPWKLRQAINVAWANGPHIDYWSLRDQAIKEMNK